MTRLVQWLWLCMVYSQLCQVKEHFMSVNGSSVVVCTVTTYILLQKWVCSNMVKKSKHIHVFSEESSVLLNSISSTDNYYRRGGEAAALQKVLDKTSHHCFYHWSWKLRLMGFLGQQYPLFPQIILYVLTLEHLSELYFKFEMWQLISTRGSFMLGPTMPSICHSSFLAFAWK